MRERCASTGARSAIDPLKRIGRYSVPIELFDGVDVEVKTLVVPEGGELPPEEELAALEAAEAEAKAAEEAAVAAAAAEHAEADAAIAEALEVEDSAGEVELDTEPDGDEPDDPDADEHDPPTAA